MKCERGGVRPRKWSLHGAARWHLPTADAPTSRINCHPTPGRISLRCMRTDPPPPGAGGAVRAVAVSYKLAAMLGGSSITSAGFQSMETKPGVCSTRLSQARIEGKVERSKSQRSATWV